MYVHRGVFRVLVFGLHGYNIYLPRDARAAVVCGGFPSPRSTPPCSDPPLPAGLRVTHHGTGVHPERPHTQGQKAGGGGIFPKSCNPKTPMQKRTFQRHISAVVSVTTNESGCCVGFSPIAQVRPADAPVTTTFQNGPTYVASVARVARFPCPSRWPEQTSPVVLPLARHSAAAYGSTIHPDDRPAGVVARTNHDAP